MFAIFEKAVTQFLEEFELKVTKCNKEQNIAKNVFVSEIDINGDILYKIYLVVQKTHLNKISEAYFGDRNYEIDDLLNEITNQIVGSAKVIATEHNLKFDISTPKHIGKFENIEFDYKLSFKLSNRCFYMLFKEEI